MHVDVEGGTIKVRSRGRGPGLVMVHGIATDAQNYVRLAHGLSRFFTVHSYNRRGRGTSPGHCPERVLEQEIADLKSILAVTGARRVFAHSFGAQVALLTARTVPLDRLTVYDPASMVGDLPVAVIEAFGENLSKDDTAGALLTMLTGMSTLPLPAPGQLSRRATSLFLRTPPGRRQARFFSEDFLEVRSMLDVPDSVYQDIRVPVAFTYGAKSQPFFQRAAQQIPGLIPGPTTLAPVPGGRHFSPVLARASFISQMALTLTDEPRR